MSVALSAYLVPISTTYSDRSHTMLSQSLTCPTSPRAEMAASGSRLTSLGPTLAKCYEGIPEEFAPQLPVYEPLPPPLQEPERTKPVPYKEIGRLSSSERREYVKACKMGMKDLTANDQIIVSSVLSQFEALINTIDCFPSDEDAWHLMLVSNAWGVVN
jgi:hypothetical protein